MKEAGNTWEHYIRDHERYASDEQYAIGWNEGEAEGKRLQVQAQAIGDAMAGSYIAYQPVDASKKSNHRQSKIR
jgi:carbohydrate-selective porin OprB